MQDCTFCQRIEEFKQGRLPSDFIAELPTGYLLLCWYQYYPGYCLFVSKQHAKELDELPPDFSGAFYADMLKAHQAVKRVANPAKMNVASLGNEIKHVHWHIIPRQTDDAMPESPIWELPKAIRQHAKFRITDTSHLELIEKIRQHL